jgi:SAM-dependent methyltransferase
MNWNTVDWKILNRLRAAFLDGSAGATDYWRSERELESYDATFAQRIGWKWDRVLGDLKRRGWSPPRGEVLDWGCGTGIASRKFLEHFGAECVTRLYLCDRSPLAMRFAAQRVRGVETWQESAPPKSAAVLLISHAMAEQPEPFELPCYAASALIVEPGTREMSGRLVALRERLRGVFGVVAPCTHQNSCGMLSPENARHWCHHFAPPPPKIFRDGNWARFAKLAGIDLRSLPVSYLALDRRGGADGGMRMIGRPRVYKAHALLLGCDADGVREVRLTKREDPEGFRRLKKGALTP